MQPNFECVCVTVLANAKDLVLQQMKINVQFVLFLEDRT